MRVLHSFSEPALGRKSSQNEDKIGWNDQCAWAIDGVTKISQIEWRGPEENEVVWFVKRVNEILKRETSISSKPLHQILKKAVRNLKTDFHRIMNISKLHDFEYPRATIAILRKRKTKVEYLVLGDSILYLQSQMQGLLIQSHTISEIQSKLEYEILTAPKGLSFYEIRETIINPLLIEMEEDGLNQIPSLRMDPKRVDDAIQGSMKPDNYKALLMTDGFSALVDVHGLYKNHSELLVASGRNEITNAMKHMREREKRDPGCISYPRLKQSDDASFILAEITK